MENKLSNSQEWVIGEVDRLKVENAKLRFDKRELAEHLAESGREHFKMGNFQLALKIKTVVKRLME